MQVQGAEAARCDGKDGPSAHSVVLTAHSPSPSPAPAQPQPHSNPQRPAAGKAYIACTQQRASTHRRGLCAGRVAGRVLGTQCSLSGRPPPPRRAHRAGSAERLAPVRPALLALGCAAHAPAQTKRRKGGFSRQARWPVMGFTTGRCGLQRHTATQPSGVAAAVGQHKGGGGGGRQGAGLLAAGLHCSAHHHCLPAADAPPLRLLASRPALQAVPAPGDRHPAPSLRVDRRGWPAPAVCVVHPPATLERVGSPAVRFTAVCDSAQVRESRCCPLHGLHTSAPAVVG